MNEWGNLKIILPAPLVRIVYRNRTNEGVYMFGEREREIEAETEILRSWLTQLWI